MRWIIFAVGILAATTVGRPAIAQSDLKKDETLGFELSQVVPSDRAKGKPVGRVFYEYIFPDDVIAESSELSRGATRRLAGEIFGALKERYIEQHTIIATREEVEHFNESLRTLTAQLPDELKPPEEFDEIRQQASTELGEAAIKTWKFDRALYERYGGIVVFQQANPQEPIGAYTKFLEQMEQARVFEIFDEQNRSQFWDLFSGKNSTKVSKKDINFDKPWWLQKRDKTTPLGEPDKAKKKSNPIIKGTLRSLGMDTLTPKRELDEATKRRLVIEEKLYDLRRDARKSYEDGKIEDARHQATELLKLAQTYKYPNDEYDGDAIHQGNLVLGRIALREGKTAEAKRYLLEMGKTSGSPVLGSFGPNMSLAKELLEKGEREIVLEYFELCRKFWKHHQADLDEWTEDVNAGRVPEFRANLVY